MEKEQKKNLIRVFKRATNAVKKKDVKLLRSLSNQTVHDASIFQDEVYLLAAVIIYSLSKIYQRENYCNYKTYDSFCYECYDDLKTSYEMLRHSELAKFETHLKNFSKKINKLDKKFKHSIKEVIEKAKIHKASRLHEHGVSLGKTAELLGISQFELMDYVGETGISDVKESYTFNVKERLKLVRSVFK